MTVLVDLKGKDLEAKACGGCSGSSSDNRIRAKREDEQEVTTAAETAAETAGESGG